MKRAFTKKSNLESKWVYFSRCWDYRMPGTFDYSIVLAGEAHCVVMNSVFWMHVARWDPESKFFSNLRVISKKKNQINRKMNHTIIWICPFVRPSVWSTSPWPLLDDHHTISWLSGLFLFFKRKSALDRALLASVVCVRVRVGNPLARS